MYVKHSSSTIVVCGEMKILMMLLHMSMIHQRSVCGVLW